MTKESIKKNNDFRCLRQDKEDINMKLLLRRKTMYIHERNNWTDFSWDNGRLLPLLASVRHLQGRLLGHIESLGFD